MNNCIYNFIFLLFLFFIIINPPVHVTTDQMYTNIHHTTACGDDQRSSVWVVKRVCRVVMSMARGGARR